MRRPATPKLSGFRLVIVIAVAAMLAGVQGDASPMSLADAHVFDGGMFFSEEAVSEADDIIRGIKQSFDRDVMVETYAAVPDERKDELPRDGRDKFYEDWLNRRAKQLGVRGVFVLMTREPGRVQVGVDKATRHRAFTLADGDSLKEILGSAFRARKFDRGLLEGVRFIKQRMGENLSPDRGSTVPVLTAPVASADAKPNTTAGPARTFPVNNR
jgi:hypothetical protein